MNTQWNWSMWDIVIPSNAAPAEVYAAQELQTHLALATGVTLPVRQRTDSPDGHIFLGADGSLPKSLASAKEGELGVEDLWIVIRKNNIGISGGSPRGTLYGVYTFLENYLGVRFLTPDHTHVPRWNPAFPLPETNHTFHPVLSERFSYYGAVLKDHAFGVRLRNNMLTDDPRLGGRTPWQVIGHSVSRWVTVNKHGKEHPEYFAEVDGKRRSDTGGDHWDKGGGTQPCMTHPDVQRLITEGVLEQIRNKPELVDVPIGQNDSEWYCRCPECRAVDEREGSHMGSLLTLVNGVAETVTAKHKGVFVGTLAYMYSRQPPQHLRPGPNVAIQLCSIEACMLHAMDDPACPLNVKFCRDIAGWGLICDQVRVWNYNVNFKDYLAPCPNLQTIGPNIRFFVANRVRGLFMQSSGEAMSTEMADLKNYLICRLMWDPSLDENVLIEEFLRLHYGRAATSIDEYIRLISDIARDKGIHRNCYGTPADFGIDEAVAAKGLAILEQGLASAENEEVRLRVEKALIPMWRMQVEPVVQWFRKNDLLPIEKVTPQLPASLAGELRPKVRRFVELCDRHGVNQFAEGDWATWAKFRERFRAAFSLKNGEAF